MFEALALLAVATVCVLGWFGGSLFVCVFLSLGVGLVSSALGSATVPILLAIWAPRLIRLYVLWVRSPHQPLPPPLQSTWPTTIHPYEVVQAPRIVKANVAAIAIGVVVFAVVFGHG
jgi:hypothetical protein